MLQESVPDCCSVKPVGMLGMPLPVSLFPFNAMFWFIIAFGIGYLILSLDISKNHGIVLIGLIAKLLFCIDCLFTLTLNEANMLLLWTGIIEKGDTILIPDIKFNV